jgi:hypothetical protein
MLAATSIGFCCQTIESFTFLSHDFVSDCGVRNWSLYLTVDSLMRVFDCCLKISALAAGRVRSALQALNKQRRVKEIPDVEERIRAIAKSYVQSPENTLIVSPDNASRRGLNAAVRHELKANGALALEDHNFGVLVQRQDMTGAERSWASHYEINDVVRYARGSKAVGIKATAYASGPLGRPPPDRIQSRRASSFRPRLCRHQPQLPGPYRPARPRSCRYQCPPGSAQLTLRLRLHFPRQPRRYALHGQRGKTRPAAWSGCLEDVNIGYRSGFIPRARGWTHAVMATIRLSGNV